MTTESQSGLLRVAGVRVEYPGVVALDAAAFELARGEVHALLGENGAGKSTLIRVLCGLARPKAGEMQLEGRGYKPQSPRDAEASGVSVVHQELDLIPTLSVADNLSLGRGGMWSLVRPRARVAFAERALKRVGITMDVHATLGGLSPAYQQMVAIARAISVDARVLVLDEPTSSLDQGETAGLLRVMRELAAQGLGVVFVTHFLDQVYAVSDRITVLRNGSRVGMWGAKELSRAALVEAMTGRSFESLQSAAKAAHSHRAEENEKVLEVRGLGSANGIAPTNFSVGKGEAIGLAGLLGSGRTELARAIFGADRANGSARVKSEELAPPTVRGAIAAGVALCPEDRKGQGLVLDLSVRENIVLAMQARRGALKPISRGEQLKLADHYVRALKIKCASPEVAVRTLSGGNQQKVLLARWLAMSPVVLILDEPTRGVDVGAKAEIEALVSELRKQGMAIIYISAELEEVVRTCERVLVLRDRAVVGELGGDQLSERAVLEMIAGTRAKEPA